MVRDSSEQIEEIVWNVQGKVQEVRFEAGKAGPDALKYEYDPMGNRLAKKKMYYGVDQYGLPVYWSTGQYYVRDPQGNVLAVYEHRDRLANVVNEAGDSLYLEELHLYGSARLGILKKRATLKEFQKSLELPGDDLGDLLLFKSSAALVASSYHQLELGRRRYELSNHLGNVLATVSDKSLGQDSSQTGQADYYLAQVSSASLYYPFGWEMPGRKFVSGEGYRFGFNGKEDDRDWGTQNIQDYGFRLYNPSVGKFLSVDPLASKYPFYTPYQFASNTPITAIDIDGLESNVRFNVNENVKGRVDYQLGSKNEHKLTFYATSYRKDDIRMKSSEGTRAQIVDYSVIMSVNIKVEKGKPAVSQVNIESVKQSVTITTIGYGGYVDQKQSSSELLTDQERAFQGADVAINFGEALLGEMAEGLKDILEIKPDFNPYNQPISPEILNKISGAQATKELILAPKSKWKLVDPVNLADKGITKIQNELKGIQNAAAGPGKLQKMSKGGRFSRMYYAAVMGIFLGNEYRKWADHSGSGHTVMEFDTTDADDGNKKEMKKRRKN
ncbi:hypothetical protein PPO43_00540 [Saprospira sp. CCB-QB6]|uniref:RHS repeat domain-containing protein n=1 Tax=Saprospira sp. CCB-QB6 TaxID=3023936 RepID=UPI00234BB5ED|nr:RHS repeat-associated core domain-containing protein [Saprospira sp. CCB-QB6]WCL81583.1 hypothetical protein PPO43_00540 [Saprospira sp. CCB-QB6]